MQQSSDIIYYTENEYVLREFLGEYLLIPTGRLTMTQNNVITISETAALLWKSMKNGKNMDELCEILLREYNVDEETARRDVKDMIDTMSSLYIITGQKTPAYTADDTH